MTIEMNPQTNLPFVFSNLHRPLDDKDKTEAVKELARLIFLLWKTQNELNKAEKEINE